MSNIQQKAILRFKDSSFPTHMRDILLSARKVKVQGLGVFEVRTMKPRKAFNVATGKPMIVGERNKIVFRPTKALRESVEDLE